MSEETPKKRGRGRPRKGEIIQKTAGTRGKVGRPKGDASIINEYKARMLASPKSAKVLETIFDAALDKEVTKDGGRSAIQINITGVGGATVDSSYPESDPIEGELAN